MGLSTDLRPAGVLCRTVDYLLGAAVLNREDVSLHVRYEFVNDRLRAVRQV
jgi:hypothetical protein